MLMGWKALASIPLAIALLVGSPAAMAQHQPRGGGGGASSRPGSAHAHPFSHAPAAGLARGGHFTGPAGAWVPHPVWRGVGEFRQWRGGHWWRGTYAGRYGAWWIVGPDWYWYPSEIATIPDPLMPPSMAPGYWYWCDTYQQYYPYVGSCPSGWRAIAPQE
jgi:hypothetical protein